MFSTVDFVHIRN